MQAQLEAIREDFERASARLENLVRALPARAWLTRPPGGGWSPAECVAHLNLTSERFLPLMRAALAAAGPLPPGSDRRLRRGLVGWLLWRTMPPPVRFGRSKTTSSFMPPADLDPAALAAEFRRLQQEQLTLIGRSRGLAIDRVLIQSPFAARTRYNLFACLGILPRHQHRHLWQAEEAARRSGSFAGRAT